jgi:hypothetical protein
MGEPLPTIKQAGFEREEIRNYGKQIMEDTMKGETI